MPDPGRQRYSVPDPSRDRVELLKDKLYSRVQAVPPHRIKTLRPLPTAQEPGHSHDVEQPDRVIGAPKRNLFVWFFLCAIGFFALAAGYAAFVWFGGSATVSADNVDVKVVGPVSINGGEKLSLDVIVSNNNPTDIELADLFIEYPDGTKAPDLSTDRTRERQTIGTVKPGQAVKRTVEAVLFGPEQTIQHIKARVVYRIPESNGVYEKEKEFAITLAQSPLAVKVSAFDQVIIGQETAFTVDVRSNSASDVNDVMLKVDYPFGFRFLGSNVAPIADNGVWYLGTIKPQETKSITINGAIDGNDGDQRAFRFSTGVKAPDSETSIGAIFATDLREIRVSKPFLDVALRFEGEDEGALVVTPERTERGTIVVTNNLDVEVTNLSLDIILKGPALDKTTVAPSLGFFRSTSDTLSWDTTTVDAFKSMLPGDSVSLGVAFATKPLSQNGVLFKNPEIQFSATINGRRVSEENVPEEVTNTIDRVIKVNSGVTFEAVSSYSTGPFDNFGPVPPRADTETSYTVTLAISNTSNALADGKVTAILPTYMIWNDQIRPTGENVTFDPASRTVTWRVGDVPAGTGYDSNKRAVAFQVTLVPGLGQIGTSPLLLRDIAYTYFDRFTLQSLSQPLTDVSTRIEEDPMWDSGLDLVKAK
jgi:hypothetical protein